MLTSLLAAWAVGPSNLAVHSLGAQGGFSAAAGKGDLDFLLAERLRWSVSDTTRVWLDARFLVDPKGPTTLERYRVRRLGVELTFGSTRLLVGRHPVEAGGPRLVDGLQVLHRVGDLELGVWGGLAPDLFTTAPRVRPGFGPMVVYTTSTVRASLVGEVVAADGGLDRAGTLVTARWAPARLLAVDGRLDLELASAEGGPHLADGRLGATYQPTDAVRFGVFYSAFSSLRYLRTEALDPELRRFDSRILEEGLAENPDQDTRDPYVNHMVGTDLVIRPPGDTPAPFADVRARYRYNPDVKNRFSRLTARVGMTRIAGAHELGGLLTIRRVNDATQIDAGAQGLFTLGDGCCRLDTSALLLLDPQRYTGPGFYADLFLDAITDGGFSIGGGLNGTAEPIDTVEGAVDAGVAGFVRLTWRQRARPQDG
ncbi:MAG: hypothetical protein KC656_04080 [Myxococcales bacterium]|nr:hypothetical protein [Myxococcales bacterium]